MRRYWEKFVGLRSQLNAWHRQSAELHNQREEVSRSLAVLEERQRSLLSAQSSVLADQDRTSDEERIAQERLVEAQQEAVRLQSEYEEAQLQYALAAGFASRPKLKRSSGRNSTAG
jgi:chromosome segregation protein